MVSDGKHGRLDGICFIICGQVQDQDSAKTAAIAEFRSPLQLRRQDVNHEHGGQFGPIPGFQAVGVL